MRKIWLLRGNRSWRYLQNVVHEKKLEARYRIERGTEGKASSLSKKRNYMWLYTASKIWKKSCAHIHVFSNVVHFCSTYYFRVCQNQQLVAALNDGSLNVCTDDGNGLILQKQFCSLHGGCAANAVCVDDICILSGGQDGSIVAIDFESGGSCINAALVRISFLVHYYLRFW